MESSVVEPSKIYNKPALFARADLASKESSTILRNRVSVTSYLLSLAKLDLNVGATPEPNYV